MVNVINSIILYDSRYLRPLCIEDEISRFYELYRGQSVRQLCIEILLICYIHFYLNAAASIFI